MQYVTVGKENGANIDIYYKDWVNRKPIVFSNGWRGELIKRVLATVVAVAACAVTVASVASAGGEVRFATFNASLNRSAEGLLVTHLSDPDVDDVFRRQIRNVAEVIQLVRRDVLLINEFDFDPAAADLFRNFLEVSQISAGKCLQGCADNNGQFGGTISRIALGTASYRTLENCTGSPSKLTGIASSV